MHAVLTKPLDWFSIQLARLSVHTGVGTESTLSKAETLLQEPDFFCDFVQPPADFIFLTPRDFRFTSPIVSPWEENNVVFGKFFPRADNWREIPTIILLHGWNAEAGYRILFPYLAWRLVRAGLNAAMIELPYHCQRKPRGSEAVKNFLSDDLASVVVAMRQAIADARSMAAWLNAQGCPQVGVWGISLGAWLGGLLACVADGVDIAVMLTPVSRIDRVIDELDFCKPIRRSLGGASVQLERLNLISHRPKVAPADLLIVASEHDLFAPVDTLEELWHAWGKPEMWRTRHGHISVLMSALVMERTVGWIAERALRGAQS